MAGTIIVDRIESDASYASSINVAAQVTFSNTVNFGVSSVAPTAGVYSPSTNNLAFTTASTERFRVDSSGNMGIGNTVPGCKLEVTGLIRATSLTNPTSGSGIEVGYDGTQGVIQAFSNRVTNTSVPINIQGDLKMNSGYGSSVIAYGCRAWVNFNGKSTVAIRASGNVSSITDNGTGDYTVNFTTAMPDINYCSLVTSTGNEANSIDGYGNIRDTPSNKLVGSVRVQAIVGTSTPYDTSNMNVAIFR